ncbi:MAG: hypothetical protein ACP5FT_00535 [Acidilobus sp.]
MRRRSISDVVAEILLILVVLSVGATLLGYYLYNLSSYESYRVNEFDELAYIVPVAGVASNGTIKVVFNTGPYGIEVYQVLVNGTPSDCMINVSDRYYTLPALLPAAQLAEVLCTGPSPAAVTIVTNSGEYEVRVSAP